MGVGDHGDHIIQRDLPKFFAFALGILHHEKAALKKQVPPVIRYFDDAAYHVDYLLKPGSRSSPMGDMLTRRALKQRKLSGEILFWKKLSFNDDLSNVFPAF